MTFTEIPKGTQNWDVNVNAAFVDLQNQTNNNLVTLTNADSALDARIDVLENPVQPFTRFGFVGWNYDPVIGSAVTGPGTDQQLYMLEVQLPNDATVTNVNLGIGVAGSGFTANRNFVGIYNTAGTLLMGSADQATTWSSAGLAVSPLSSPIALAAGTYFVGFMMQATTKPTLLRTSSTANLGNVLNANQSAEEFRFSTDGTGLTALPASVNMTTRLALATAWWVALS